MTPRNRRSRYTFVDFLHEQGSYLGRSVVVAPGRSPYLPPVFDGVPFPRAVHTSRFPAPTGAV